MTETVAAGPYTLDNPFKFLEYYREAEQAIFTGRDREIREAMAQLTARPTFVLCGRTGVGKTSFLLAGLFPALRSKSFGPVYVRLLTSPQQELREVLCETAAAAGLLPADGEAALPSTQSALEWLNTQGPVVLAFDQFEEFFLRFGADERLEFIRELARLAGLPGLRLRLVFSLREDFLAQLDELRPSFPDLFSNQYRLAPLTAFGAREAIERPLVRAGVAYDRALLSRLIDALMPAAGPEEGFDPPLLQILCSELYHDAQQRHAARGNAEFRLTVADLQVLGGLEGVFRRFLDRGMANLPQDRTTQSLVRLVIDALITEERTKRAVTLEQLLQSNFEAQAGEVHIVVEALVAQRLVRKDTRRGVDWYELVHERLVSFLLQWLETDEEFFGMRAARQTIQNAVAGNRWRRKLGPLISGRYLTRTVGPYKERLRLDADAVEFLFWSALFNRHGDCGFWAGRLGCERARAVLTRMLAPAPADADHADWEALRLGAAWACGAIPMYDPALAETCLQLALDVRAKPELRRAASQSYAVIGATQPTSRLMDCLGIRANTQMVGYQADVLAWRGRRAAAHLTSWVLGASRAPGRHPDRPPPAMARDRARLELLGDLWAAGHRPDGLPWLFRWEARRRADARLVREHRAMIHTRAGLGAATGFVAGFVWALVLGVPFSVMLAWIQGAYGDATLLFVGRSLGIGLPLATLLGAGFGYLGARSAARHAALHGEGHWARAVLTDAALVASFFLCLCVGGFLAQSPFPQGIGWHAAAALGWAIVVFLPLLGALAGMAALAHLLVGTATRRGTWAWAWLAGLGLPHALGYVLFCLDGVQDPVNAWRASTFVGIFLSFLVFVLTLALARAARKEPAPTLAPAPPPSRWRIGLAQCVTPVLAGLTVVLSTIYYGNAIPYSRSWDLSSPDAAIISLRGSNSWSYNAEGYTLRASQPTVLECAAVQNPAAKVFVDAEQARFDRSDRQLFFLPAGTHYAYVRSDQNAPDYHFQLVQPPQLPADGTLKEDAEWFTWCPCVKDAVDGRWHGQVSLQIPEALRQKSPFVVIGVGKDFIGVDANGKTAVVDGELSRDDEQIVADASRPSKGAREATSNLHNSGDPRWTVLIKDATEVATESCSVGPSLETMLSWVRTAALLDFPSADKPTGAIRVRRTREATAHLFVSAPSTAPYSHLLVLVSFRVQSVPLGVPFHDVLTEKSPRFRLPTKLHYHAYKARLEPRPYCVSLESSDFSPNLLLENGARLLDYPGSGVATKGVKKNALAWAFLEPDAAATWSLIAASTETGKYRLTYCSVRSRDLEHTLHPTPTDWLYATHVVDCADAEVHRFSIKNDASFTLSLDDALGCQVNVSGKGPASYYAPVPAGPYKLRVLTKFAKSKAYEIDWAKYRLIHEEARTLDENSPVEQDKYFNDIKRVFDPAKMYIIDLIGEDGLDTYLELRELAPERIIARDDDSGEGHNARVIFRPSSGEELAIRTTTFAKQVTGAYRLRIWENDPAEDRVLRGTVDPRSQYKQIGYAAHFDAEEGEEFLLQAANDEKKPYTVVVTNEQGAEVRVAHPWSSPYCRVEPLPRGHYRVVVSPARHDERFRLTLHALTVPEQGAQFSGSLQPNDPLYARPTAKPERVYAVHLNRQGFDRQPCYYTFRITNANNPMESYLQGPQRDGFFKRFRETFDYHPAADGDFQLTVTPISDKAQDTSSYSLQITPLNRRDYYKQRVFGFKVMAKQYGEAAITPTDLAWSYCMLGEWQMAKDQLKQVNASELRVQAWADRYWNAQGWIAAHEENWTQAVKVWRKVSRGYFASPDGEALESKEKYDTAKQKLAEARAASRVASP